MHQVPSASVCECLRCQDAGRSPPGNEGGRRVADGAPQATRGDVVPGGGAPQATRGDTIGRPSQVLGAMRAIVLDASIRLLYEHHRRPERLVVWIIHCRLCVARVLELPSCMGTNGVDCVDRKSLYVSAPAVLRTAEGCLWGTPPSGVSWGAHLLHVLAYGLNWLYRSAPGHAAVERPTLIMSPYSPKVSDHWQMHLFGD